MEELASKIRRSFPRLGQLGVLTWSIYDLRLGLLIVRKLDGGILVVADIGGFS
jgi:hypothetical protein